ncbi:hypothetical protein [Gorillibacterium timonense]|uniref:hypothetical protein n=1 Tax=Gorillibacterium timonense TaxID=1689269 RepID=UPI0011DDF889|nr:hypothetical protein [Gorillibacterium timonense]
MSTVEADADQDGDNEIIATVGTNPQTSIYKWKESRMEVADLNELMKAGTVLSTKKERAKNGPFSWRYFQLPDGWT